MKARRRYITGALFTLLAALLFLTVIPASWESDIVKTTKSALPGSQQAVAAESTVVLVNGIQISDLRLSKTVGNHSYIPFQWFDRNRVGVVDAILSLLDQFEMTHQDLRITGWMPDQTYAAGEARLLGVWIDHVPLEQNTPENPSVH